MELAIFVGWLICGGIAAKIYSDKGRSAVAAFLVGFFFGPLGIILALLSSASNVRKCPRCAEKVLMAAQVCRYCGTELPPPGKDELPKSSWVGPVIFGGVLLVLLFIFLVLPLLSLM